MKKPFICLSAVFFLILFSAGCIHSNRSIPDFPQDVRVSELVGQQQLSENKTITVGLQLYLFQIRTDKLTEIQEQISRTDALPVKYSNPNIFPANGLIACAGDRTAWQKIAELLAQSQPEIKRRISLLITENITEDIVISETLQPVSVFYRSNSTISGIGFDTGQVVLRIKATSLIGLRNICRLDVVPVYKVGPEQKTKKQPINQNICEFAFESAAFNVRLQPGQFVLLAPAEMQPDQTDAKTTGNIMFYSQYPGTVSLCLIACNLINDPL